MRRLLLAVLFCLFAMCGNICHAAESYYGHGIRFTLPEGFQQVTPRQNFIMEAIDYSDRSNLNLSIAPYNGPEPTEAELEKGAEYIFSDYSRRGIDMKVKSVCHLQGNHKGIRLIGRKNLGQYEVEYVWLFAFIHGQRYVLTYVYAPNRLSDIFNSAFTFGCVYH